MWFQEESTSLIKSLNLYIDSFDFSRKVVITTADLEWNCQPTGRFWDFIMILYFFLNCSSDVHIK